MTNAPADAVTAVLEAQDLTTVQGFAGKYYPTALRKKLRLITFGFFCIYLPASIFFFYHYHQLNNFLGALDIEPYSSLLLWMLAAGIAGVLLMIIEANLKNGIVNRALAAPTDGRTVEFRILEQGFESVSEIGTMLSYWNTIRHIDREKGYILVFVDAYVFHYIPERAFTSPEAADKFYQNLLQHYESR